MQYVCCCYDSPPCVCDEVRFATVRVNYSRFSGTSGFWIHREFACQTGWVEFSNLADQKFIDATVYMHCIPSNSANTYSSLNIFQVYGFSAPWVDVDSFQMLYFNNFIDHESFDIPTYPHDGFGCDPSFDCCGQCDGDRYLNTYQSYRTLSGEPITGIERGFQATTSVRMGDTLGEVGPGVQAEPDKAYRIVTVEGGTSVFAPTIELQSGQTIDPCAGTSTFSNQVPGNQNAAFSLIQYYELSSTDCNTTEVGTPLGVGTSSGSGTITWLPNEIENAQEDVTEWDAEEPPCSGGPCCDHVCDPASTETNQTLIVERKFGAVLSLTFQDAPPWL